VLRDLLSAARREGRKTRIIGIANLNHSSFRKYARIAEARGLLVNNAAGYGTTPLAEEWLRGVDEVLAKKNELDEAVRRLVNITSRGGHPLPPLSALPASGLEIRYLPELNLRLSLDDAQGQAESWIDRLEAIEGLAGSKSISGGQGPASGGASLPCR
jgi:predicted transcriptional regulator